MALVAGCKHEIEVSIPPEVVEEETGRVVNKIQNRARLPGFRPGKAPASMVRLRFADDIRKQVMETLIPRHLFQKIEAEGLRPVGTPDVSNVVFQPGEPLSFKAEFEVLPDFELKEYRGLQVEYNEKDAGEEEVAAALDHIREKHAVYRNLDPRPLDDGDVAVVRLESLSTPEGVDPIRQDELTVDIGDADTLAAFTENLRGVSPGEEREFDVVYPDDYGEPRLAGKSARFRAHVLGVRSKELPELNDDLAKDEGDFRDLQELRGHVRSQIESAHREEAHEAAKAKLVEMLVDAHDFPVPETLVERQIAASVERGLKSLADRGVDPTKVRLDWKKIQEREEPRTIREIRAQMILDKIASQEQIHATQEEVDRQVQLYARQTGQTVAAARARLAQEKVLDRIASRIRHDKTLQFLFEQARKG